jgi:hypothetical protein
MIGRAILSIAVCLAIASVVVAQESPREADFKTSDGVRIHYYMLGTKGTPVVLIHGYTRLTSRAVIRLKTPCRTT